MCNGGVRYTDEEEQVRWTSLTRREMPQLGNMLESYSSSGGRAHGASVM